MRKILTYLSLLALNLFVVGCHSQMDSEELKGLQSDCRRNIFHGLSFIVDYEDRQKYLVFQHIHDGKMVEEFTVAPERGYYFSKRAIFGDDTYLLKINSKTYILTELKGEYNARCTMFGCYPACIVEGYKINGQKKNSLDIILE